MAGTAEESRLNFSHCSRFVPITPEAAQTGVKRFPPPAPTNERQDYSLPFFFSLGDFSMIWKPNVTVAAVIERDGRFLLVEEETAQGLRFNQPAGHWEPNETLEQGSAREALEETAYHFTPQHLTGIYRWHSDHANITYLRFAFCGEITGHDPDRKLDEGIVRAVWMTIDEVRATQDRHRSPLILRCIEDYLAGKRYPLELITHYD